MLKFSLVSFTKEKKKQVFHFLSHFLYGFLYKVEVVH